MIKSILTGVVASVIFAGTAHAGEVPKPVSLEEMVENRVGKVFNKTDEITAIKLLPVIEREAKVVRREWVDSYEDYRARITRQRAEAASVAAQSSQAPAGNASAAPSPSGDIWYQLALCESGANPATNTGNGYYGAFQFSLATWQSVGGTGLPSDHSYGTQLGFAQTLQARSGWGQWPHCAAQLGLL